MRRFLKCAYPSSRVLVPPGGRRYTVTKMYHLCLLEPALFRFLHDAPRSELPIDLLGSFRRPFEDTWRQWRELPRLMAAQGANERIKSPF